MKKLITLKQFISYAFLLWNCFAASAQTNVLLGPNAGQSMTTGTMNTFLGFKTGMQNTVGSGNTFTGYMAGRNNFKGSDNTFVGRQAGENNLQGNYNSFMGAFAGQNNSSGNNNTFIGYQSGLSNTNGSFNTFVGRNAGWKNETGKENTFIGYAGLSNTNGDRNTFVGEHAGVDNTTGSNNTFIGSYSGPTEGGGQSSGSGNTYLGYLASGSYLNNRSTAIGRKAYVYGNDRLVLGATDGYNGSTSNTKVGITAVTPWYNLHVGVNSAGKPGSNVWTVYSDRRLKEDIIPFTEGLNIIEQIKPVRYRYNGKANTPTDEEFVGIVAQDIQNIAPYMVSEFVYEDTTGMTETYLDYDGNAMNYLLINAIKELKAQNEGLQAELLSIRKELGLEQHASSQSQARLLQNYPNPTNGTTTISFLVPAEGKDVRIRLTNIYGQKLKDWAIIDRGLGQIALNIHEFAAGTYLYQLIIDGEIIDSKQMVLK